MSFNSTIQKLEPGDTVRLIEIDGTEYGAEILRFHDAPLTYSETEILAAGDDESKLAGKSMWWQGLEYGPWPFEVEDLEMTSDGQAPQPKIKVSNVSGVVTALCLTFDDMAKFKVTIHDTFAEFLDARNFENGNPSADPTEEKVQVYYIDRKSSEDDESVEFELASPADLRGIRIPTRQIHGLCTWCHRGWYRTGRGCDYAGTRYFDVKGNPVDDPSKDVCGGFRSDCQKRFGDGEPIPFGGFPGAALIKG